ncbi:hypothetical protein MOPEL_083_00560 [Mobilicoccus pelagius NBRC 104925]|uniref:Uncharacterized protein n=2 Tax=Mobilicoccus TaxID=984996 RepID=H5USZ3_9MICO|nr:hypothetical protein MOPEL_083_00560 [Mobilicoccus pelagius NBRC 104925]
MVASDTATEISATPTAPRATSDALQVTEVSPQVLAPGQDVTLAVTLRNTGTRPASPTVRVGVGPRLRTRTDVSDHATAPRGDLPRAAGATVPALHPGATTTVPVTIPAGTLHLPRPYGVLPVTVTSTGLPGARATATFLPYQVVKEYQPLSIGVALPVTPDPDPAVLTGDQAARLAARTRMTASGSRLDRILTVADAADATLLVDPSLLVPEARPTAATAGGPGANRPHASATGSPSSPPTSVPADGNTGAKAAKSNDGDRVPDPGTAFARRLADSDRDVWFLPPGDPDVSALASAAADASLPPLPQAPTSRPGTRRAVRTLVWPAGTASSQVRKAVFDASSRPPAAVVMRETRTDPDPDRTGPAPRRDGAGHHVLVVDDRMSALLAHTSGPADTSTTTQRLLADSVALLGESPGVARSVLLLPDRPLDPDPAALTAALRALRGAPWIAPVDADALLTAPTSPTPVVDATTPPTGPASPLVTENLTAVRTLADRIDRLRPSFGEGTFLPADAGEVLLSTRWRGEQGPWSETRTSLQQRVEHLSHGVRVVPSAINFFAEHGALQITVVNDLDTEVRDVRLHTDVQGRPPRLVVHSPPQTLTIRPHSRATVRLDTEAVAAGVVPVTVSLRTTAGAPLGEDATVRVRVQPTNGWLLLAAGGVVGIVFVLGLFRAIRAGERRVAASELEGLDLR